MVFGGEDGEEGDDVRVGELLQVFEFADGVRGHAFGVFFLDLDLLDGDEMGGVGAEVAEVDVRVGSFSKLLTWGEVSGCGGERRGMERTFDIFQFLIFVHLLCEVMARPIAGR